MLLDDNAKPPVNLKGNEGGSCDKGVLRKTGIIWSNDIV